MTQPYVGVVEQVILEPPLAPDHFLARVGFIVRRYTTCNRTGGTLVALFQIAGAGRYEILDKLKIRFNCKFCRHE
jgi:hypothetical protein